jgi:hypothetical protein
VTETKAPPAPPNHRREQIWRVVLILLPLVLALLAGRAGAKLAEWAFDAGPVTAWAVGLVAAFAVGILAAFSVQANLRPPAHPANEAKEKQP